MLRQLDWERDFQQSWWNTALYRVPIRADLGCCTIQNKQPKQDALDLEHERGLGGRLGPKGGASEFGSSTLAKGRQQRKRGGKPTI